MTDILISIIAFIGAIGILVTFHEYGHFWVARKLGIKVLKFSVGFGRHLCGWKDKKGTEYVISAIPLGGYVKMLDEREGDVTPEELPQAFNRQPVWKRFVVVLAGPVFNFIFAIFAYWILFMVGLTGTVPKVGHIDEGSIAAASGLQSGAQILAVDTIETKTWSDVFKRIMPRLGDKDYLRLDVKQEDGEVKAVHLNLLNWEIDREHPNLLESLGIEPYVTPTAPVVLRPIPGEPADRAGFLPGDVILEVNDTKVDRWLDFTKVLEVSANQPLVTKVQRGDRVETIIFSPRMFKNDKGQMIGFAGLMVEVPEKDKSLIWIERLDPWHAMIEAFQKTAQYIGISFKMIGKMVIGDIGLYNLSGPITIAHGAGMTAIIGAQYYLNFLALISISLGVINLLPIPILDGGHLLYYAIEWVTGKPVSDKTQILGLKIGMMFLIFIMTIAFYNDLVRMF